MKNLLLWAIPALIPKRRRGQGQAAERDECDGLIVSTCQKRQDEEDRQNSNSNQLEDKEQPCLRRVNRAIFKANSG